MASARELSGVVPEWVERERGRNYLRGELMPMETIIHNAKIATNGTPSFVAAIAIERGKIAAVGTNDEILRLRSSATDVID
jgi:hypothetical protein